MANLFVVTDDCELELLDVIEKYLKELPSNDNPKLYFSGEYDSNQSKFEYGSNNLEFGVLANNKTIALVLLRFLRIIIDDRPEFLLEDSFSQWVEEYDPKDDRMIEILKCDKELEIEEIIRRLVLKEDNNTSSFSLDQPITTDFYGDNFTKRLDEIDIWTLPRIMKEMRDLY